MNKVEMAASERDQIVGGGGTQRKREGERELPP